MKKLTFKEIRACFTKLDAMLCAWWVFCLYPIAASGNYAAAVWAICALFSYFLMLLWKKEARDNLALAKGVVDAWENYDKCLRKQIVADREAAGEAVQ